MSIGDYVKIDVGERHLLSPSSLTTFFDNSGGYYAKQIERSETFNGNTYTVFGTILHYLIEMHYKKVAVQQEEIDQYINAQDSNPDVDTTYIHNNWESTWSAIQTRLPTSAPSAMEYRTSFIIDEETAVGGSVDYRRDTIIGDYKTCKTLKNNIGDYKWQLMVYAWCDMQAGISTDTLQIIYIQRPDEGHPSEKTGKIIGVKKPDICVVNYTITPQDWTDIEDAIKLEADTYKLVKANPEIARLVYRRNPLSFRQ